MSTGRTNSYSDLQIALHWIIAVLVLVQTFVTNGPMGDAADARDEGAPLSLAGEIGADLHVAFGVTIFLLALVGVTARVVRGAPGLPDDESMAMAFVAHFVLVALYAIILFMPVTGFVAWYWQVGLVDEIHSLGENAILMIVGLHVFWALYQHFIARTDVLVRMLCN